MGRAAVGRLLRAASLGIWPSSSSSSRTFVSGERLSSLTDLELKRVASERPRELGPGDWKRILTPEQFRVIREHGTEPAFSSALNRVKGGKGSVFKCAGCSNPLFEAETKFDSGTGWPSFYEPIQSAVATSTDCDLGYARTEVHCSRCLAHLGHVFNDGPPPTNLRYCMNGVAMTFEKTRD